MDDLCERLESDYDIIMRNVKLHSKRKRVVAEIDILAIKAGICDIYEVKCSHRISKAKRQVKKIRKVLSRKFDVGNSFFFCGASDSLIIL